MSKKILGICAALVALAALAIPSAASAALTLQDTVSGVQTKLEVGAKITATQDEHSVFEASGSTITCDHNWMTGEVHVNNGTEITGTITGAKFQGPETETRCISSLLGPTKVEIPALTNEGGTGHWCIKNIAGADEFEFLGRGCTETGNGLLTFILRGSLTCRYKKESGVRGTFTTTSDPNPATLKVTGEPEFIGSGEGNSFLCPAAGKITTMAFNLYTDNEAEEPVYINDVS